MPIDLKSTVAKNVRALLGLGPDDRGATAALIKLGFSNGDATRILGAETSLGIDKMAKLAEALNVEPWMLFVPDLQPDRLPSLEQPSFRWPFRNVDPEAVTGLVGTAAANVEQGLMVALATAGVSPRKQPRAA